MDWVEIIAVVVLVAGFAVGGALAVSLIEMRRALRRALGDSAKLHGEQTRRLAERVVGLQKRQQEAQLQIEALTQANRKLAQDVARLSRRLGDDEAASAGTPNRILH